MKVYFRNNSGKELMIGEAADNKEANRIIKRFCSDRNFKIYYTRQWIDEDNQNRTWVDVGDHFCFFIIER